VYWTASRVAGGHDTLRILLSSEEYDPANLIKQAKMTEQAGFEALWISDHFHPWLDEQGNSSFVWSVIGAISQVTDLPVTTAVTCPAGTRGRGQTHSDNRA
jgi:alkanesulfonate monooxygenase SsuD/methylene tetrahydromethanopterin reductase-like flavin-dependent oxidoreductase (luciferase family)